MNIINNYFLLYQSTNYAKSDNTLLINFNDEEFDKIAALILTLTCNTLEKYLELNEFRLLTKKVITNGFLDNVTLFEFCSIVLDRLIQTPTLIDTYIDTFNYLHVKKIITSKEKSKLLTVMEPLTLHVTTLSESEHSFIASKESLISTLHNATSHFLSDTLIEDLVALQNSIESQTFSIGITGVMNVGKSTFINALLSKELLGSSVVAETANLTLIKYAEKPYAKVTFFSSNEFEEILHTYEDEKERNAYLKLIETSLDINEYIKEKAYSIEIKQSELSKYTSASDNSGLSHIVKEVEIGVNLPFLKDSLEIVDTPGLDDTLIVRETMTQNYVSNCDLLIHLMNVNQSATQKDVDFIIDAVMNQNVSTILILLTKADNVTPKELEEVITYTKSSIENQLHALNADATLSKVISSLKFLSISAKMALDIRTNEGKVTKKTSIENSGILEVEHYLNHTLFSDNSKNEQIITTSAKKLRDIIESQMKIYHYNLVLYSKDENSLENELKKFNQVKEQNRGIYSKIGAEIKSENENFKIYLDEISTTMNVESEELSQRLLSRVTDEITYSFKKDAKPLKPLQLKMIIDKTINHGFVDIVREHKHKLQKKVQSISKNIELSFATYNIEVEDMHDSFSIESLFQQNSNTALTSNTQMIYNALLKLSGSVKKNTLDSFREAFSTVLKSEFVFIQKHLDETLKELNSVISSTFFSTLEMPIKRLEKELHEYEESLEKQIFLLKNQDEDIDQLKISTQSKINKLEAMMEAL